MANELQSNINNKLLKQFAPAFESTAVAMKTTSQQLVNDFDASTGGAYGAVSMKRPTQDVPYRSPDGDMTGNVNPTRTGKVQAEVSPSGYITVYKENEQVEEALEFDQGKELMGHVTEDIITEAESELVDFMARNAALVSGDPTQPIAAWSDVAKSGALLKEAGAPTGKRYGLINCFDEVALANLQTQLGVNPEVSTAWAGAVIKSNFAGISDVMTTNNLPEYTAGNEVAALTLGATPSPTYTTYADTYRMTLTLAGATATTGTLKKGQSLQFPDTNLINFRNRRIVTNQGVKVPLTLTILEDAIADGSGDIVVTVSGAAIFEAGALGGYNTVDRALTSGDDVTVLDGASAIVRPALTYCKDFVGMGSVGLPKLHATDSSVVTYKGTSIRVHKFSDGVSNKNRYRFDMLPTFACFNPFWGVKVHGA